MNEQKIHTGVAFIFLRNDGKLLLQLRDSKDTKFPNQWCFPGGRKDGGESHVETVIREAHEEYEIALSPEDCTLLHRYDVLDIVRDNHVFVCRVGNQKAIFHEGADMKWVDVQQVFNIQLGFEQENFLPALVTHLRKVGV